MQDKLARPVKLDHPMAEVTDNIPQLEIHHGALVCNDLTVLGRHKVTIGKGTVIQPGCTIVADAGPIIIGDNNIIEELCVIRHDATPDDSVVTMTIGAMNVFQVCSTFSGTTMGNLNLLETKSIVLPGCAIGTGCVVGVAVKLSPELDFQDEFVVFRVHGIVQTRKGRRLREQHVTQITRYLDLIRSPQSKCNMSKFHQLKPTNPTLQDNNYGAST